MSSIFKRIVSVAAPIAGFALGGPIGAAIGGGLGGLASGGGLKGAGLGALGGAAFGYAPAIAGASGLQGAALSGLTRGIQGAALGGIGGGPRGAILGAGLGGLGGYIGAGGNVPGLGSIGGRLGPGGFGPPTPPSGVLGNLSGLTNATAAGGSQPMNLGSLLTRGLGSLQTSDDIDEMQNILERQSLLAQNQLQPYSQAGQAALANLQAPSLEALQNDPGYQFRLQQGQQALERSLAAQGLGQSGAALRAAQEYGQGLADQTYNDFFARQAQLAGMGQNAAGGLGSLYTNLGNVQAAALLAQINERNRLYGGLGSLFGGGGFGIA